MAYKLTAAAVERINEAVDDLFDRAKLRLLGPKAVPKRLYVGFRRPHSLPGVFEAASAEEGVVPDLETLDQLISTASNYLDSLRLRSKAKIVTAVQAFVSEAGGEAANTSALQIALEAQLYELFGQIKMETRRIVDTETQKARNIGGLEGIIKVNAAVGVKDPVVFFVVVRDTELCEECRRLHMLPDGKTPRVWKLSELAHGYHKRGDPQPSVEGLHPHCRCSCSTLMPGFGFSEAGYVTWKGEAYDELEVQRQESNVE